MGCPIPTLLLGSTLLLGACSQPDSSSQSREAAPTNAPTANAVFAAGEAVQQAQLRVPAHGWRVLVAR